MHRCAPSAPRQTRGSGRPARPAERPGGSYPGSANAAVFVNESTKLLGGADGQVLPGLQALHQALVGVDRPATALSWLSGDTIISVLGELASGTRPLSHEALDELPASKTLTHLRAVLVATHALPARDEHLSQLEAWTAQAVAGRSDPEEKQLLHRYAVWHVLRRLRRRVRGDHITANQATVARENIGAAAAFLDWLSAQHLTLTTCTQAHLDLWMATATSAQRGRTGPLVRWAKKQKLTRIDFPATAWTGPTGVLDTEAAGNKPASSSTTVLSHPSTASPGCSCSSTPKPRPPSAD